MGRAEVIQTGVVCFQLNHCLSVRSLGTRERSRLLTLRTNLVNYADKLVLLAIFITSRRFVVRILDTSEHNRKLYPIHNGKRKSRMPSVFRPIDEAFAKWPLILGSIS